MVDTTDVVVVGGGVIGLSLAWELARSGRTVRVLDQAQPGREASWAGAGMLPPGNRRRARCAADCLRGLSHELWPDWSALLQEESGISNEFHRCGALELGSQSDEDLELTARDLLERGIQVDRLTAAEARDKVTGLSDRVEQALWLPDFCQVRNPRHLKALLAACLRRGVRVEAGEPVVDFHHAGGRMLSVRTPLHSWEAGQFVLAGGSWTGILSDRLGHDARIEPMRGQIVLLQLPEQPFRCIIEVGKRYLVPRRDGRVLIGATEERVGFVKENTAEGVSGLLAFAESIVPSLKSARFETSWSGLRPWRPNGLPLLSWIPGFRNAAIAGGHFREGLHLSPATAQLISQLLVGTAADIPEECRFETSR
jgi:glycine oxidase